MEDEVGMVLGAGLARVLGHDAAIERIDVNEDWWKLRRSTLTALARSVTRAVRNSTWNQRT